MKNKGILSPLDKRYLQEVSRKTEEEYMDKAFLYMLAIPLNVLVNDYWKDEAKDIAPKFIDDVISLYEAVQDEVVSNEELAELLENFAGVKLEAEWLNKKEN